MLATAGIPAALGAAGHEAEAGAKAELPQAALEATARVQGLNELAMDRAPVSKGEGCDATLDIPGMGPTCRGADGLLRVQMEDGSTFVTHGMDAPPPSTPEGYLPRSAAALEGASSADIDCVGAGEPRYTLVYARPSGSTNRYSAIAWRLRAETYKLSAFLDAESQSVASNMGKRLRMSCTAGGSPTVLSRVVSANRGGASIDTLVSDLAASGLQTWANSGATERYIVFYDGPAASGAAGQGHHYGDDSAGEDSLGNSGGLYAVEYSWSGGGGVPHWDVLLHEVGHTMGAVNDSAPQASGASHCNDGSDIMCYSDGGSTSSYTSGRCGSEQFDCRRDSYFNPDPPAGSYLDSRWNVAATYNRYLEHRNTADVTPPTAPGSLVVDYGTDTLASLSWGASSDDRGVVGYRVYRSEAGGSWSVHATVTRRATRVTGLQPATSYDFAVRALDAAGNLSPSVNVAHTTNAEPDVTPPTAPVLSTDAAWLRSARLSWTASSDDTAVAYYTLQRVAAPGDRSLRHVTHRRSRSMTVKGLRPSSTYEYRVLARDHSGNVVSSEVVRVRTRADTVRPTRPGSLRVAARGSHAVVLDWDRSFDAIGVRRYYIYRLGYLRRGSRLVPYWRKIGTTFPRWTSARVGGLAPGQRYAFSVRAVDDAGNASWFASPTGTVTRR